MNNKLAASITKIRIEKQALDLQSLLPVHLRDEKVARAVMNPIISGWMNRFKKLTKRHVTESFEKMDFKEMVDKKNDGSEMYVVPRRNGKKNNNGNSINLRSFKWDKLCPHFIYCFPEDKSQFLKHELVQSGDLVLQNKAFIVGSAVFSKLLDYFEINGDVLQTHILSPRSTAYLASLLLDNPRVDKFRVFGAGKYFKSYKAYFEKINATNVILYEQNFNDMDTKLGILEKTVAIYAPPPSSFSGSTDPIELICSRGGDLKMLKFLSEPEMNDDGHKRAAKTLEEQRKTLKNAMGRPQIQFILYETHSIVQTENQDMVTKAVDFMNRKSKEKHVQKAIKEKERLEQLAAQQEAFSLSHRERDKDKDKNKDEKDKGPKKSLKINISKLKTAMHQSEESLNSVGTEDKSVKEEPASIITAIPIDPVTQVVVPPTDLFESVEIPDFCQNRDDCVNKQGEGCYLALLKRKEIVRMDSKYLIKIAEMRGIFGDRDRPKKVKSKAQMRAEKKEEERLAKEALEKQKVEKHNTSSIDKIISRLIQPTQATIIRITRDEIWRRNLHISVLTLSKFFPPRCPRCDFYSQNYYFLPDKFVAVHQFNGTLSLRFDDHIEEKRRASKWWKDTVKYLGHLKMINSLIGGKREVAFDKIIFSEKTGISPLKLIRFPRGYVAMPSMKCRLPQERRLKYSMSVTLLDISKPGCKRILDAKMRRRSVRVASALKNYNKCYLCLHEYFKLNDLQHLISKSLKKQQ